MGWRARVASGWLLALFAVRCGGQSVKGAGSGGEGNGSTGAVDGVDAGPTSTGGNGGTGGAAIDTGGSGPTQATCDGSNLTCDCGELPSGVRDVIGQQELEALAGYTQITGEFAISGAQDLSPLACLTRIEGNAEFWDLDAPDVTGLDALTEVTGAFGLEGSIESLHGLESLERVGLDLRVSGTRVRDLTGLESLVEVGGTLSLSVRTLANVEALSNVTHLGGLHLAGSSVETLAGLENVLEIAGDPQKNNGHLYIQTNSKLRDLHALANLTHVSGDFVIESNEALSTCEVAWLLDSVMAKGGVGGTVTVSYNGSGTCD